MNELEESFTSSATVSVSKDKFMQRIRALASQIQIAPTEPIIDVDVTNNSYSELPYQPIEEDISNLHFSGAFGTEYDAYHVAPIEVYDIGDEYSLNKNYKTELEAMKQNRVIYDEEGNLKTETITRTANAPTFNRALPLERSTIEDQIAILIEEYVKVSGEKPDVYLKIVATIKEEKIDALLRERPIMDIEAEIEKRGYT